MGKIDRFLGMEKKWSDTTSDYNKEAKSSIKDLKKKMKKSKKKFDKNVKKTSKLLAKVAKKILKAFLPKKFDGLYMSCKSNLKNIVLYYCQILHNAVNVFKIVQH